MNLNIDKVIIATSVPTKNVEEIRNALCEAGAGVLGNYTHCSMATKCIGSFKPNDMANPHLGEKNQLDFVEEEKLETICEVENVKKVISKLREIHPYEEPIIEIIPLLDEKLFK